MWDWIGGLLGGGGDSVAGGGIGGGLDTSMAGGPQDEGNSKIFDWAKGLLGLTDQEMQDLLKNAAAKDAGKPSPGYGVNVSNRPFASRSRDSLATQNAVKSGRQQRQPRQQLPTYDLAGLLGYRG